MYIECSALAPWNFLVGFTFYDDEELQEETLVLFLGLFCIAFTVGYGEDESD